MEKELLINKKDILVGLNCIGKITKYISTLPILSNILMETKENLTYIMACDLESACYYYLQSEGIIDKAIIPFKIFYSLIKNLKEENIRIYKKDNEVIISDENKKNYYNIKTFNNDDYPELKTEEGLKERKVRALDFKEGISKSILFVGDPEKTRQEFGFCNIEFFNDNIKFVATDGNRLSYFIINKDFKKEQAEEIIYLSKASLNVLEKILDNVTDDNPDEEITINFSDKFFVYKSKRIEYITRTGQINFPNYSIVLPNLQKNNSFTINRKDILDALQRLYIISKEIDNKVIFEVKDNLIIKTSIGDIGEGAENIEIKEKKCKEPKIFVLDNKKLIDGLKTMDNDFIKIYFTDSDSPITFYDSENYFWITMPYRM